MKSGGDTDIKQLELATALSIAGQLRDRYARLGYLTTYDIGAEIKQPGDPDYVAILTGAVNDDGVIDNDEYVTLNGISPYYNPLLEAWRRQSPIFARLKVLDEKARQKCGNDTTCREEKQAARQAILLEIWGIDVANLPNIGEQNAAIETLLPWLKDPEVAQHYTPLFESAIYFAEASKVSRRQIVKKLKAELESFIFSADRNIQPEAVKAVGPEKVIPLAEQRLKKNPRDQQAFLALVCCLAVNSHGDNEEGIRQKVRELTERYERELKQGPSDPFLHWALGHLYDISPRPGTENERRIVALFEKAAELEPENPRYQFDAGMNIWLKQDYLMGNPSEIAFGHFKKAVQLDPDNTSYRITLAEFYFEKRRYADAIRQQLEVVKVVPGGNFTLGHYYLAAGQIAETDLAFEKYLSLYPGNPNAIARVASEYSYYGREISSRPFLEQLLRFGIMRYTCGTIADMYCKTGDTEQAEKYYRMALRYRGNQDNYFEGGIYLGLGSMFFDNHNYQAAADAYRKAIELDNPITRDAEIYRKLGESLSRLGRHWEAIEALEKAVAQYPGIAFYHKLLGDAYFAAEYYSSAEETYLRAIECGMDGDELPAVRLKIDKMRKKIQEDERSYRFMDIVEKIRTLRESGRNGEALRYAEETRREYADILTYSFYLEYALTREKRGTRDDLIVARVALEEKVIPSVTDISTVEGKKSRAEALQALARILRRLGGDENNRRADELVAEAERLKMGVPAKP